MTTRPTIKAVRALAAVMLLLLATGCPEKPGEKDEKLPDINGPMSVDELEVRAEADSVEIKWQQPTSNDSLFNRDLLGFMIVRTADSPTYEQPSREDRFIVGDTLGAQTVVAVIDTEPVGDLERKYTFTDTDVQPGVTYHYQIFTFDEIPNYSDPIQFEATPGGLIQARLTHTQTLLVDGRVLFVGGIGSGGPLDTAEIFDPDTMTFAPVTDAMSRTRFGHTATLLEDGRVLIAGGYEEGFLDTLDSAEIFDPDTETFQRLDSRMTVGRALHTATRMPDGRVLIVGGTDGVKGFASADLFDPATETFSPVADEMTNGRYAHTATTLASPNDDIVMIAGGVQDEATLNQATFFDTAILDFGRFFPTPDEEEDTIAVARMYHTASLMADGRVVLAGGFSGELASGEPTDSIEIFNPGSGTSHKAAVLARARSGHQAYVTSDDRVLVIGGIDPEFEILSSTELFDPSDETVEDAPPIHVARTVAALTVLDDGRVLLGGGNASSDPFQPAPVSTAEIMDPDTLVWSMTTSP